MPRTCAIYSILGSAVCENKNERDDEKTTEVLAGRQAQMVAAITIDEPPTKRGWQQRMINCLSAG